MDMAEMIRAGRFQHIAGAGHWPQWEQRDVFNRLVLSFLDEEQP
jgi:2-hydroxy-6-oxonona-2,4-dienedioate hydrolase